VKNKTPNQRRRRIVVAAGVSAVAAGAALVLRPGCSLAAYPQGSPMLLDVGDLRPGSLRTVEWKGLPVWVLRRTAQSVAALATQEGALADPQSQQSLQPSSCSNRHRSLRPEIFVAIGLCTHQGCAPALLGDSGFLCPCHASRYDLAGRVFRVGPATANLVIPAYRFEDENRLVLGTDV
jgi:ubiquinol-cytochrome c reductase iron-sulfur subunit